MADEEADEETPLDPVEGTTFGPSARKGLYAVGGGLFFVFLAVVVVVWRFAAGGDDRPSVFLTLGAVVMGLLGFFFIGWSIAMMVRKRRVVIGADRVQIVQGAGGVDVVMVQLMYANVAGLMMMHHDEGGRSVRVQLVERGAEGTYDAIGAIRGRLQGPGFELVIVDDYQGTIDELLDALDAAVVAWRREQEDAREAVK